MWVMQSTKTNMCAPEHQSTDGAKTENSTTLVLISTTSGVFSGTPSTLYTQTRLFPTKQQHHKNRHILLNLAKL